MIKPYDKHDIVHIGGVDHPESISVGPKDEAYTTGTGCQVYRVDLENGSARSLRPWSRPVPPFLQERKRPHLRSRFLCRVPTPQSMGQCSPMLWHKGIPIADRDERSTGQVRGGTLLDTTSRSSNRVNRTLEGV